MINLKNVFLFKNVIIKFQFHLLNNGIRDILELLSLLYIDVNLYVDNNKIINEWNALLVGYEFIVVIYITYI